MLRSKTVTVEVDGKNVKIHEDGIVTIQWPWNGENQVVPLIEGDFSYAGGAFYLDIFLTAEIEPGEKPYVPIHDKTAYDPGEGLTIYELSALYAGTWIPTEGIWDYLDDEDKEYFLEDV